MNRRDFIFTGCTASAALVAWRGAPALSQSRQKSPLLFGVDYYPDQTPEALWEQDAVAMVAAGVTNVRIAEFAWALMEPSEGHFDFNWLKRSTALLHAHGIAIILGTPSAAPPPWLTQKYPEVLEVNDHGLTLGTSGRRFTCPTNRTYRRLSLAVATQMAHAFAGTPGVIGWQIDNEFTLGESGRCYCQYCREGFAEWLKNKYVSLDALNSALGTVFWSRTYTDWSQIPVPLPSGAPPNPGLALDYDRYQSYANASFLEEQLTMLRQACPTHFITTNNASLSDTIDLRELYRNLDFVAGDNYPGFAAMFLSGGEPGTDAPADALAPVISLSHDVLRGIKDGKPFLIMEEQSGKSGQPSFSPQPEKGQLRLWSFQAIAHGAMGINYFRWDTANFGAEEYWHGLLRHDRSHSPGFDEIVGTMRESKVLGEEALNAPCVAEIALCFDYNSDWALGIQPGQPKLKYLSEIIAWYGSLAASQAGIDIVDASGDLSGYKVLCAPAMYIVSARQADRIRAFVQAGGTFITGVRLGVKDEHSRIVSTPLPGLLRDVMGVELIDYQPIYSEKQGVQFAGRLGGASAECHVWADILAPAATSDERQGVDVLATYTVGDYAGKAAITSHRFGKGRAIYIGAHLEGADLGRVLLTLLAEAGVRPSFKAPSGVEIARRQKGPNVWTYMLNHTGKPQPVTLGGSYRELLTQTSASGTVELKPYGVQVLVKA